MTTEIHPGLTASIDIHLSAGVKHAVEIDVPTLRSAIAYKAAKDKFDAATKAIPRTKGGRVREKDWPLSAEAAKAFHAEAHEHWKIINAWRSGAAVATYKKYAENVYITFIEFNYRMKTKFAESAVYKEFHTNYCSGKFMTETRYTPVEMQIGSNQYTVFFHPSDERQQVLQGFSFHQYQDGKPYIGWADIEARCAYRDYKAVEDKAPFVSRVKRSSFDCSGDDARDLAVLLSVAAEAADTVAVFNTLCLNSSYDFRKAQEDAINDAVGFRVFGWTHDFKEPELPNTEA